MNKKQVLALALSIILIMLTIIITINFNKTPERKDFSKIIQEEVKNYCKTLEENNNSSCATCNYYGYKMTPEFKKDKRGINEYRIIDSEDNYIAEIKIDAFYGKNTSRTKSLNMSIKMDKNLKINEKILPKNECV